ncbi:hypothetical protein HYV58_00845 [Candidatus Peregrinibacteria bacterium]|nr:hypothetical protein [Candidatus Peregrinibacteria bacterium]
MKKSFGYAVFRRATASVRRKLTFLARPRLKNALLDASIEARAPLSLYRAWMHGDQKTADRICGHEFDLLGSGTINLGKNIDWQEDFKFKRQMTPQPDPKVPWELARFQFLLPLAAAYEVRREEKYAAAAKNLIHDFILKNPYGKGMHWKVPMEAAIRACQFAVCRQLLRNSASWKDHAWEKTFLASILEHATFISRNLEFGPYYSTNHLIADYTGLLFIGTLFPEFRNAEKWRNQALNGL